MKIIEESKVYQNFNMINELKEKNTPVMFYNNLDSFNMTSLQSISFDQDFAFFNELDFILSVIMSIINHPHLSNKGEEVVKRCDQAGHISIDSFQRVLKEPSFWKEMDFEMKPHLVYHYQYTDDYLIYENLFIGLVIKTISNCVDKYLEFYYDLIPSITFSNNALLKQDDVEKGINKLNRINRKLMFIKDTYFYKVVSKVPFLTKTITPTNILVKNRLYNLCFRFYKQYIAIFDYDDLSLKLKDYYIVYLLKALKENFTLDINSTYESFILDSCDFLITIKNIETNNYIIIEVYNKLSKISSKHALYTILDRNDLSKIDTLKDADSTKIISIWNIYDSLNKQKIFKNLSDTKELIKYYLDTILLTKNIKQELYTKYCPVCRSHLVDVDKTIYTCNNCQSKYTFVDTNKAWFIKLGGIYE